MEMSSKHYVVAAGFIFVTSICSVMLGMAYKQDRMLREQAHRHASALFDFASLVRQWNVDYGGVFVEKRPGVDSNPYLEGEDIMSVTGKVYTEKNHALMIREISESAKLAMGFSFHITSLKPLNPHNAPDDWEKEASAAFGRRERERVEVTGHQGNLIYRFMKPLYAEAACLSCHSGQGYEAGDVMGGVSVGPPFDAIESALHANLIVMTGLAVTLLVLFGLTLYFFIWKMMDRLSRQKAELAALNETKDRFLGMAAHDLRTPLATVVGLAGVLREEMKDPSKLWFLDDILESSARMLNLINECSM